MGAQSWTGKLGRCSSKAVRAYVKYCTRRYSRRLAARWHDEIPCRVSKGYNNL